MQRLSPGKLRIAPTFSQPPDNNILNSAVQGGPTLADDEGINGSGPRYFKVPSNASHLALVFDPRGTLRDRRFRADCALSATTKPHFRARASGVEDS